MARYSLLFIITLAMVVSLASSFAPTPNAGAVSSQLRMGLMDDVQGFFKRFSTKATASHILIKGGADAEKKLQQIKAEVGDSPIKFAEAAAQYSACPSARSGGALGTFGPGAMVREFDQVVFNDAVGVVHGPIKTQVCVLCVCTVIALYCLRESGTDFALFRQFGYHLIYINERTE